MFPSLYSCSPQFLSGIPAESERINRNKTADWNDIFFVRLLIKNFPSYSLGSSYVKSRRLGWWYRLWNPLSRTGASFYLLSVVINLVKAPEWVTEHSIEQILIEHQLYKQPCAHCWGMQDNCVMLVILKECFVWLRGKINVLGNNIGHMQE